MRVVAGTARGLRLRAPEGNDVRPTSDRVREATFNSLGSMGVLVDATVLDLFAGSGAMGIEALSRGAAHCTFVDNSPKVLRTIRDNLSTAKLAGLATVRRANALEGPTPAPLGPVGRQSPAFDLVILDPPYGFEEWTKLLGQVDAAIAVIESNREVELPERWRLVRARSYGTTVVTIAELASAREDPDHPLAGEDNP